MNHILPSLVAFLASLAFMAICYNFAVSINLVDNPNKRKNHKGSIPLIGGIAVIFGFSLACLLYTKGLSQWRPLFFCIIPLIVVGVLDDHGDISITKRVWMQLISCCVMIYYGGIKIIDLGDILGFGYSIQLKGYESIIITIVCVIGVINALNLIDGIDGLCASICLVTIVSIMILSKAINSTVSVSLLFYFSSALCAFLLVNLGIFKKYLKKIFLGDAGTTIIGFFLCWNLIYMSNGDVVVFRPITAVWLIGLPIMDTITVIITRLKRKRSPFTAGRDHIHHLLLNYGFSSIKSLLILVTFAILLAVVGILGEIYKVREHFLFYGILIIYLLYYLTYNKLNTFKLN